MIDNLIGKSRLTPNGLKVGDYTLLKILGKGQFGKVWKAKHQKTNKIFAVKQMDKRKIINNPLLKRLLKTEISIMNEINHANILHLYEFLESENNFYLVVNFCNKGDLQEYLQKKAENFFEEPDAVYFLKQIMNGFQELRKNQILHRDFKLANLFLNDDTLVIGDFGFAKSGNDMAKTRLGTPVTMAYEILTADPNKEILYDSKADLWSIGIVYYQMLFGKPPFNGFTVPELIRDIKKKVRHLDFPKVISEESKDLINRLLEPDPKKRINWGEFFNHSLFFKYKSRSPLDNILSMIGGVLGGDKQIDEEFVKNQRRKTLLEKDVKFLNQEGLLKFENGIKPVTIKEKKIKLNNKVYSDEDIFKEIEYRYSHEKNKLLFIIYTVKKIQKYLKTGYFLKKKYEFQNISIFLTKKALSQNQGNIINLEKNQNIYNINPFYFKKIINSDKKSNLLKIFTRDSSNFKNYLNLLLKRSEEKKIKIQHMYTIKEKNPLITGINNYIFNWCINLKGYLNDEEISGIEDLRKRFLIILFSIKLSMEMKGFDYFLGEEEKFDWKRFYEKHENLDIITLKNSI